MIHATTVTADIHNVVTLCTLKSHVRSEHNATVTSDYLAPNLWSQWFDQDRQTFHLQIRYENKSILNQISKMLKILKTAVKACWKLRLDWHVTNGISIGPGKCSRILERCISDG